MQSGWRKGNYRNKILIMLMLAGMIACTGSHEPGSEVKITSLRGKAYQATLPAITIQYRPKEFFSSSGLSDAQFAEMLRQQPQFARSIEQITAWKASSLILGALRLSDMSSASVQDIKILGHKDGADGIVSLQYTANLVVIAEEKEAAKLSVTDFWMFTNITHAAELAFYEGHKSCFDPEIENAKRTHPMDFADTIFYYFNPGLNGCDLASFGDSMQKVRATFQYSAENVVADKYPEYNLVWQDHRLSATLMFTPVDGYSDTDPGAQNYLEMIALLKQRFGAPAPESSLPDALNGATPRPTAAPQATLVFHTQDGRELDFHLLYFSWGDSVSASVIAQIGPLAGDSDYVSYNGHAGYGMNIEAVEQLVGRKDKGYQIFFANGCSTFSYLGQGVFHPALSSSTAAVVAKKNIDVVSNLTETFFTEMPITNMVLIDALIAGNDSYRQILQNVDKTVPSAYNAHVVVRGEEDNLFVPGR